MQANSCQEDEYFVVVAGLGRLRAIVASSSIIWPLGRWQKLKTCNLQDIFMRCKMIHQHWVSISMNIIMWWEWSKPETNVCAYDKCKWVLTMFVHWKSKLEFRSSGKFWRLFRCPEQVVWYIQTIINTSFI